jgi:hypothetical protein
VELHANKYNKITSELQTWLHWARDKANWHDPLVANMDPILGKYAEE